MVIIIIIIFTIIIMTILIYKVCGVNGSATEMQRVVVELSETESLNQILFFMNIDIVTVLKIPTACRWPLLRTKTHPPHQPYPGHHNHHRHHHHRRRYFPFRKQSLPCVR